MYGKAFKRLIGDFVSKSPNERRIFSVIFTKFYVCCEISYVTYENYFHIIKLFPFPVNCVLVRPLSLSSN